MALAAGVPVEPVQGAPRGFGHPGYPVLEPIHAVIIAGEEPHGALKALRQIRQQRLAFAVDLLGEATLSEAESAEFEARRGEILASRLS